MMPSPRLLAALSVLCTGNILGVVAAAESSDPSPSDPPAARKSHIQPVGEMAAAARQPDTLGLHLSRASEVLRQQLALGRGAGLVVDDIVPGSVAEQAGFKRHDVLVLLDDQMLLLPEQLTALLEASDGRSVPECTVLRGGAKVTIPLGRADQVVTTRSPVPPTPARLPRPAPPREPQAMQQTAAKPATSSRLRAPASALALAQAGQQQRQTITKTSAAAPAVATPSAAPAQPADEVLLRQDPDYQIKLSRGNETRLVVLDLRGRIVFNDAIETPEQRSLIPPAVRQRVEQMERSLESTSRPPVLEIGRLEVEPIEIR